MPGALVVAATVGSYVVGWSVGVPFLVPVLNACGGYPFMLLALKRGDLGLAVTRMLIWALAMGVCAMALSYARPWPSGALFLGAAPYRNEMFSWVMTGRGAESTPSQFIPRQAGELALFVVAALVTGGALAMAMGAVLMNQMGHYVGSLAAASARPAATMLLAWHPWAILRISAYVVLGVVLSLPAIEKINEKVAGGKVGTFRANLPAARRLIGWALAGVIADIVLKALIAPAWQRLLLRVVGW